MKKIITAFLTLLVFVLSGEASDGKKVFETYCWGCHHQTAVAFGPPFSEIASKRSADEIRAMITDPASVSKAFGYKRNAMPAFPTLTETELQAITKYILSYKDAGSSEKKESKELNGTKVKESYPNIAANKESK